MIMYIMFSPGPKNLSQDLNNGAQNLSTISSTETSDHEVSLNYCVFDTSIKCGN